MVGIVEGVEEIFVEWMDVLQTRKAIKNGLQLFTECLGGELDLSGVET